MIKFFKRLRYDLLEKNKTGRYLKYAIGEVVLVMIGILLALEINIWNAERVSKNKEVSILIDLKTEYSNKLIELNQKDKIRGIMLESNNFILDNIQLQNFNMSTDSLNVFMTNVLYTPTYDAPNSVTSDLINSGSIYLLSNKTLRELVTEWEGNLGKLIEEEQALVNTISNGLYPYLWGSYPIKNILISKFSPENKMRKNISII